MMFIFHLESCPDYTERSTLIITIHAQNVMNIVNTYKYKSDLYIHVYDGDGKCVNEGHLFHSYHKGILNMNGVEYA